MLEVEAQLEAAAVAGTSTQPVDSSSEAGLQSAPASSNGVATEGFYSSGKGSTWKAFKKMVKHKKEGSSEVRSSTAPSTTSNTAALSGASLAMPYRFHSTCRPQRCTAQASLPPASPTATVSAADQTALPAQYRAVPTPKHNHNQHSKHNNIRLTLLLSCFAGWHPMQSSRQPLTPLGPWGPSAHRPRPAQHRHIQPAR